MLEPVPIVREIFNTAKLIKDQVELTIVNKKNCKNLSDSVEAALEAVKNVQDKQQVINRCGKSLQNLNTCLEECLEYIKSFVNISPEEEFMGEFVHYIKEFFNADDINKKFTELGDKLDKAINVFTLALISILPNYKMSKSLMFSQQSSLTLEEIQEIQEMRVKIEEKQEQIKTNTLRVSQLTKEDCVDFVARRSDVSMVRF